MGLEWVRIGGTRQQGDAILERWIGKSHITLPAGDMTKVSFVVKNDQ